jgi:hypothetical protein
MGAYYLARNPTPVLITGPLGGVEFVGEAAASRNAFVVSCAFARRLVELGRVWSAMGIERAGMMSAQRDHPAESFHTRGFALDVGWVERAGDRYSVSRDFLRTAGHRTCDGEALAEIQRWAAGVNPRRTRAVAARQRAGQRAVFMLEAACALAATGRFSTVITPNYNDGHRNHFHIDVRPFDPRLFVR